MWCIDDPDWLILATQKAPFNFYFMTKITKIAKLLKIEYGFIENSLRLEIIWANKAQNFNLFLSLFFSWKLILLFDPESSKIHFVFKLFE